MPLHLHLAAIRPILEALVLDVLRSQGRRHGRRHQNSEQCLSHRLLLHPAGNPPPPVKNCAAVSMSGG
jgi:hypothetical protein